MRLFILFIALAPQLAFAECAIIGKGGNLLVFEVQEIRSVQKHWSEYSSKSDFPQISDDYAAPSINDHCIVTLSSKSSGDLFEVIQWKSCKGIKIKQSYEYHIYEICSEWGKDFYSFLGLKGAIVMLNNNEI